MFCHFFPKTLWRSGRNRGSNPLRGILDISENCGIFFGILSKRNQTLFNGSANRQDSHIFLFVPKFPVSKSNRVFTIFCTAIFSLVMRNQRTVLWRKTEAKTTPWPIDVKIRRVFFFYCEHIFNRGTYLVICTWAISIFTENMLFERGSNCTVNKSDPWYIFAVKTSSIHECKQQCYFGLQRFKSYRLQERRWLNRYRVSETWENTVLIRDDHQIYEQLIAITFFCFSYTIAHVATNIRQKKWHFLRKRQNRWHEIEDGKLREFRVETKKYSTPWQLTQNSKIIYVIFKNKETARVSRAPTLDRANWLVAPSCESTSGR